MVLEQSISLRDAGLLVSAWRKSTDKIASDKLLSLLKAGQIEAGFQFPASGVWWIKIPTRYWLTVGNDKFRVIRVSKESKTSGAFKIRPGDFAHAIVAQITQQLEGQRAPSSEDWTEVLKATTRKYEVEIIERELMDFLEKNIDRSAQTLSAKRSKSGNVQKEGWRDLSVILGAYVLKHRETTNERIKIEDASTKIFEIAKSEGIGDLPAAPTIKGVLSKILLKAKTLSIN